MIVKAADPRQLSILGAESATVVVPGHVVEFRDATQLAVHVNAWRPKTERAYKQQWHRWGVWCLATKQPSLPITVTALCEHLGYLYRQNVSQAGIRLATSAISALELATHGKAAKDELGLGAHPLVRLFLRKLAVESKDKPQREARSLTITDVEKMLACLCDPPAARGHERARVPRWARDRCILLLGIAGALRRAELAHLHYEDCQVVEEGLICRITRGTKAKPRDMGIERQAESKLCPVDAFEQWVRIRGTAPGRLLCAIANNGEVHLDQPLRPAAVARVVDRVAERAGLRAGVSSHSLRKSFGTWTAQAEKNQQSVMRHGGWARSKTYDRYVQLGSVWTANPTRNLFSRDR